MLKPFYQGKLDAFCAVYAVLNAFRLARGIRTSKARDILNDVLLGLSLKPALFQAFLTQQTDYINLVDAVLAEQCGKMSLKVEQPFPKGSRPSPEEFWEACQSRLGKEQGKCGMVFRFLRHLKADAQPVNRHWTTADYVRDDILHLFDCSHEAEAILNIHKGSFVTCAEGVNAEHLLHIQPDTARFISLAN